MENEKKKECVINGTVVIESEDVTNQIPSHLRSVFAEGALFLLYEKENGECALQIAQELKRSGYRVSCASTDDYLSGSYVAPDYIRYAFVVGAERAIGVAKRFAQARDIGFCVLLTAPDCDDVLCGKSPNMVFIDKNVLKNCSCEQLAAGYGIVMSKRIADFENTFARKVLSMQEDEIEQCDFEKLKDASDVAMSLLRFSIKKKRRDSAEITASVMRALALSKGRKPRLAGEYRFLASVAICSFYSLFLGSPSIDSSPPACREESFDKLDKLKVEPITPKCVDFFDINGYFRIDYILSEYRMDFLEKLAGIDVHGMQRFWRRLYDDAGYWLKAEITASETLSCMALAGAMSDNLLGYAYASGFMKRFG